MMSQTCHRNSQSGESQKPICEKLGTKNTLKSHSGTRECQVTYHGTSLDRNCGERRCEAIVRNPAIEFHDVDYSVTFCRMDSAMLICCCDNRKSNVVCSPGPDDLIKEAWEKAQRPKEPSDEKEGLDIRLVAGVVVGLVVFVIAISVGAWICFEHCGQKTEKCGQKTEKTEHVPEDDDEHGSVTSTSPSSK